jgi:hypothetical protein
MKWLCSKHEINAVNVGTEKIKPCRDIRCKQSSRARSESAAKIERYVCVVYHKRWDKLIPKPKNSHHDETWKQLKLQKLLLRRPQARSSSVGRASTANGLDVVVADFEFRLGRAR